MAKILVTGTAGFIGSHVALSFANQGHQVVGLDIINDYYEVNLKYSRLELQGIAKDKIAYNTIIRGIENISFIKLKLEDEENLDKLFKNEQFDYVVNLAAQAGVRYSLTNPKAYLSSNMEGFLNLLECARNYKIKHLVYASSSSVYGLNNTIPFQEDQHTDHPISLYAASKKSNEMMAHAYSHLFQIPTTGLRFFTVYGPWGRPDMALFIFTRAILNNEKVPVFNHGDMMRDFTYIDDIVEGVIRITSLPTPPQDSYDHDAPIPSGSSAPFRILNIGNNSPVKLLDFVNEIEKNLEKKADLDLLPIQPGDVSTTYASSEKLIALTKYTPNTSIQEGIANFIAWYKSYYNV